MLHAAKQGHNQILVRTVDTDVVVLAVMVTKMLSVNIELWLAFEHLAPGTLSILGCTQNSSWSWTREVSCTSYVPCSNWL